MDHERRMVLARRVTDYVLSRHPEVIAVAVHGSTAKGEDRKHSDLEMFAVTRGRSETRGYGIIHEGIVVEIELIPEEDAFREAAEVRRDWPMTADGWIHALPLHDPDGFLPRLSRLAANPDSERLEATARGSMTSMYEDLCKIRNFLESGEEPLARLMCHGFALDGVARFLALHNRQYFNGVRNLLTKPRDFRVLPSHFWEDYPHLLAVDLPTEDLARRAERLFEECWAILDAAGESADEATLEGKLDRSRFPRSA